MKVSRAAVGSLVFFVLVPGGVAGLVPWWLTGWEAAEPLPIWLPFQVTGGLLMAAGAGVLVHAFVRFVVDGLGTPAPIAAPERLVVSGFYRHVRNPMYVAVLAVILGQALLLGRLVLLPYAALFFAAVAAFVRWHEEPALSHQFGDEYRHYRRQVPGWWPRLRPYRADGGPAG